jgi:hypothetical protein
VYGCYDGDGAPLGCGYGVLDGEDVGADEECAAGWVCGCVGTELDEALDCWK